MLGRRGHSFPILSFVTKRSFIQSKTKIETCKLERHVESARKSRSKIFEWVRN